MLYAFGQHQVRRICSTSDCSLAAQLALQLLTVAPDAVIAARAGVVAADGSHVLIRTERWAAAARVLSCRLLKGIWLDFSHVVRKSL